MQGVAVQYPKLRTGSGSLINLEDQIRACRTQRQGVSDWGFESDGLLAMTLYVAEASKGLPLRLSPDPRLAVHLQDDLRARDRLRGSDQHAACVRDAPTHHRTDHGLGRVCRLGAGERGPGLRRIAHTP